MTCAFGASALAISAFLVAPAAAAGPAVHTCSGTTKAPGELTGTLTGDVRVSGACEVNAGNASINYGFGDAGYAVMEVVSLP